jgi:hypothetical protein
MAVVRIIVFVALVSAAALARPDDPIAGELFTFDDNDTIEAFDSPRFRLHFSRAGRHAVDLNDNNGDDIPDRVQEVADLYESVATRYSDAGFLTPVNDGTDGGDDRFDVYLVDFSGNADGAFVRERCTPQGVGVTCSGFMVQENDFAGYGYPSQTIGHRTVASHEYFHAVQAAFDAEQDAVYSEGTAVWATEQFDPTLLDLERFAAGYLRNADVPLTSGGGGPVDPFTYGAGIFFQFLSEAYGPTVVPSIVFNTATDDWVSSLDDVLQRSANVDFATAFVRFSQWTLVTGDNNGGDIEGFVHANEMTERPLQDVELPFAPASFPVFVASSRALSMAISGLDVMHVSITAPAQTNGIRLVTMTSDGRGPITQVVHDSLVVDVDVADASSLVVMVVNTRLSGSSVRPTVCIAADDSCTPVLPPPVDDDTDDPPDPGCGGNGAAGALAVLALANKRRRRY